MGVFSIRRIRVTAVARDLWAEPLLITERGGRFGGDTFSAKTPSSRSPLSLFENPRGPLMSFEAEDTAN
jgi:hypothetical protein